MYVFCDIDNTLFNTLGRVYSLDNTVDRDNKEFSFFTDSQMTLLERDDFYIEEYVNSSVMQYISYHKTGNIVFYTAAKSEIEFQNKVKLINSLYPSSEIVFAGNPYTTSFDYVYNKLKDMYPKANKTNSVFIDDNLDRLLRLEELGESFITVLQPYNSSKAPAGKGFLLPDKVK